jgi:hypothetical protein
MEVTTQAYRKNKEQGKRKQGRKNKGINPSIHQSLNPSVLQ